MQIEEDHVLESGKGSSSWSAGIAKADRENCSVNNYLIYI